MKYTLLKLVQKTLTYLDDFNVNSIDETDESEQVVEIVNQVYNDICKYPWPHLKRTDSLESTAYLHILKLPTEVMQIDWIRYNKKDVQFKEYLEFQKLLDSRDTTLSNVDSNGCYNDKDPVYWTSIDDENIIFDSYNGALVPADSKAAVVIAVDELLADTDEPNLPERFHSTLLYGVIAEASKVMKGVDEPNYIRKFEKGIAAMKRWAKRVNIPETTMPNDYSRKGAGTNAVRYTRILEA